MLSVSILLSKFLKLDLKKLLGDYSIKPHWIAIPANQTDMELQDGTSEP